MIFTFRHEFDRYLKRVTPSLPDDMRRLIDEAVAAGRITRVPQGVSAIPYPVWSGKENALVEVNPKTAVMLNREAMMRGVKASIAKRQEKSANLREQIAAKVSEGLAVCQIARALGINRKTVSRHTIEMRGGKGLRGANLREIQKERVEVAAARRAKVWALYLEGRTHQQIAELVGSSRKRVAKDLTMMRKAHRTADIAAEGIAA